MELNRRQMILGTMALPLLPLNQNQSITEPIKKFYPTSFPTLDKYLDGGIKPGTLNLIVGKEGSGKTSFVETIAFTNNLLEFKPSQPETEVVFGFQKGVEHSDSHQNLEKIDCLFLDTPDFCNGLFYKNINWALNSEIAISATLKEMYDFIATTAETKEQKIAVVMSISRKSFVALHSLLESSSGANILNYTDLIVSLHEQEFGTLAVASKRNTDGNVSFPIGFNIIKGCYELKRFSFTTYLKT